MLIGPTFLVVGIPNSNMDHVHLLRHRVYIILYNSGLNNVITASTHICREKTLQLLTVSVFYHIGGVDVFHHDRPAFSITSISGHIWVDTIDTHVTLKSGKPSHLWTSSGSCSRHVHT